MKIWHPTSLRGFRVLDVLQTLKLSTKYRKRMWWLIHFQGNKRKIMPHFVWFPFMNLIGWKKEGYNGKRTKLHGNSFNNYNKTIVHWINLCQTIIHSSIRITYIYVRIPSSNKGPFKNAHFSYRVPLKISKKLS